MKRLLFIALAFTWLFSIAVQAQVYTVDMNTINGSSGSIEVHVPDYDTEYEIGGGVLYFNSETGAVVGCAGISALYIPERINSVPVTSVSNGAFFENTELESIIIPETVELVGICAFYGCSELLDVSMYKSTQISKTAFILCPAIIELEDQNGGKNSVEITIE